MKIFLLWIGIDPIIHWSDESCAYVKCPVLEDRDKGDVLLLDSGLKMLFQGVKEMRKLSVAFDMQELSSTQTHLFLKSILDQAVETYLRDGIEHGKLYF